jgi:LysM repeat protein
MTQITITPVSYPGAELTLNLGREIPRFSDGIAKWNEVTRPRRRNAIEFSSESLLKVTFDVMLDEWPDGNVEGLIRRIMGWAARIALPFQPTLLKVAGPIPYADLTYVLTKVEDSGDVVFNDRNQRCRQQLKLELTEYVAPDLVVQSPSPAQAAQARTQTQSFITPGGKLSRILAASGSTAQRTYTVKRGDTLWDIAARLLGNGNKWHSIADLNGVRDPKKLQIGQVLKLP